MDDNFAGCVAGTYNAIADIGGCAAYQNNSGNTIRWSSANSQWEMGPIGQAPSYTNTFNSSQPPCSGTMAWTSGSGSCGAVTVTGNGTTIEASNYNFIDRTPATVSYYRLRQIDFDGKSEYSDIVTVKREMLEGQLSIAPNPATSQLNITFNTTTETATFRVFDVRGKLVRNLEQSTNVGMNNVSLNVNELAQGMYFLEVISGNDIQRTQFIKQ